MISYSFNDLPSCKIIMMMIIITFVKRRSAVASEALAEQVGYLYAVLNK